MTVKALVLCAGRGTRLGELTRHRPKPLLPIDGTPLVGYSLRLLAAHGIDDVAINLHYLADQVEAALGDGSDYGLRIHYEREPEPLGTAGAIANLSDFFSDATDVLVVYGDLVFDEDLSSLVDHHRRVRADATLLVHQRSRSNSVLDMDEEGRIVRFQERPPRWEASGPVWVNSGCQVLRQGLIEKLPARRPLDLPRDVYVPMVEELRLFGHPIRGYRIAVDSPRRYEQAIADVRAGKLRIGRREAQPPS